jgi:antiviral helicase SKI2
LDLKTGLVEVVYEWARGRPFKDITSLTDVLEGMLLVKLLSLKLI